MTLVTTHHKKVEIIAGSIRRPQRNLFTFAVSRLMSETTLRRAQICFQAKQNLRAAQRVKRIVKLKIEN